MKKSVPIAIVLFLIIVISFAIKVPHINHDLYKGSDDAWWHFRHINEVVQTGRRSDIDIYEFTTLSRPLVYPPLFHYLPAYLYKVFGFGCRLIVFLSYLVFLEGVIYILFIYGISFFITKDKLWSLIAALGATLTYNIVSKTYPGEFLPEAMADIFGLFAILGMFTIVEQVEKNTMRNKHYFVALGIGLMLSGALLTWAGSVHVYIPVILLLFVKLIATKKIDTKKIALIFVIIALSAAIPSLLWYPSVFMKFGLNPYSNKIYDTLMKGFTALLAKRPLGYYVNWVGASLLFLPGTLNYAFSERRSRFKLFIGLWAVWVGCIALIGWRFYSSHVSLFLAATAGLGGRETSFFIQNRLTGTRDKKTLFFILFFIIFLSIGLYCLNIAHKADRPNLSSWQ